MIGRWMNAEGRDERTLAFLQNFFLLIAAFGFAFYGVEHWVIDHQTLASWPSKIPLYVSLVGAPLAVAMFFTTHRALTIPFLIVMALAVLTGIVGALLHLHWNAVDMGVSLFTLSGFAEAMQVPYRPVLAALAHTHVGAVGLVVGLTVWAKPRS
jgi:pheromone shutdown protein TraB